MQTRKPDLRIVPPVESQEQWDALVESVSSEGDAIVESRSGKKAVIISYDEFLDIQEQRKSKLREEAFARLQDALKDQAERNADLSDEDIEELANRANREIREELNRKYRTGLLVLPGENEE
ncbi:MAG TPA: hypothetical protein VNZ58_02455 [Thermomicrobiales bacterium]|nr:hypothetical protein [Thermomicrobiales bacterium]